ncbi:MAG: permease [Opitutus sp.]|nr:permease [Opitutus sp.]
MHPPSTTFASAYPMLTQLKFALRSFLKTPGFTFIALLTLTLGIGANTAVFSVVHALLLRPLPYPNQHELVFLSESSEQVPGMSIAYPNFEDWRARQKSFTSMGIFRGQGFNYMGATETEPMLGASLSHDLWPTLGVQPLLGRWFTAQDDQPSAEKTVLLSERFWRRSFEARENVIGEKINLSGNVYTVIGVMSATFEFPSPITEVWTPLTPLLGASLANRSNHPGLYALGRLKPGITLQAARDDIVGIARQLAQEYPQSNRGNSAAAQLAVDRTFGQIRPALLTLFGAAAFVLLIACANVANLLLARAAARSRELVVRAALGASRKQIIGQLLTETALLGFVGSVGGVLVAYWTMGAIKSALPTALPNLAHIGVNFWVLGFAILVGVGVTTLFGFVPALSASKLNLQEALSQSARSGGSVAVGRWRGALIAGEFALTLALLVCAGLMFRTLQNLYSADPGFRTEQRLVFGWAMSGPSFADPKARVQILDRVAERLAAVPGAQSVALTNPLPMSGGGNQTSFLPEGAEDPGPGRYPSTEMNAVSPSYFSTMGITLVRGRAFTAQDTADGKPVCIIDTTMAEKYFSGVDPVGKHIMPGFGHGPNPMEVEIVGVVAHVQNYAFGQQTRFQTYRPYAQLPPFTVSWILRTSGDPAGLTSEARRALREIDPKLPIFQVRTMDQVFANTVTTQRLALTLLGVFAGLALLLASIGLYGVLSYAVSQRTREIGVRMAIGADRGAVLRLIVGQGFKLALIGLGVGVMLALALSRLLKGQLYEVSAFDPASFITVCVVLLAVGFVACLLPAWRATRINAVEALRAD